MTRRWVAVPAMALMLCGCSGSPDQPSLTPGDTPPPPVTVTRRDVTSVITLDAAVAEDVEVDVRAPQAGALVVDVPEGATVTAGQVVAHLAGTTEVRSPAAGTVLSVAADRSTMANEAIMRLRLSGLTMVGRGKGALLYRLTSPSSATGRAQINDGPGPFECRLAGGPTLTDDTVQQVCVPSEEVSLYPGLPGVVAIPAGERRGVLTLPLGAVAGVAERGQVARVDEKGATEVVNVVLGISDGVHVEITAGLAEGDAVSARAPSLRAP